MYSKVLLPVDGSELSTLAIAQVPNLVGPDGVVLLVEVIDSVARILTQTTPAGFAWDGVGVTPEIVNDIITSQRTGAAEHLAAARARLEAAGVAQIETRVLEGVPGPAIVETALGEGVGVVVMATHGRSGFTRTVLGSVADHVVRHLHGVPVLLIHPDDDALSRAQGAGKTAARA